MALENIGESLPKAEDMRCRQLVKLLSVYRNRAVATSISNLLDCSFRNGGCVHEPWRQCSVCTLL